LQVGLHEVISGWDMGILGDEGIPAMHEGGKRRLVIPSGGRLG
jgi:peptidylprolyl isomerase